MKRTMIIVAMVLLVMAAAVYGAVCWNQRRLFGEKGAEGLFNAMNKDFNDNRLQAECLDGGLSGYNKQGAALWVRIAVTAPAAQKFTGHGFVMELAPGRHEYLVKAEYRRDPGEFRRFQPVPGLYEITRLDP